MNLIHDIKKLLKDDKEHSLKVEVSWEGVKVYLDYDPELSYKEDCVIPICYVTLEQFCYIPHDDLVKMFKPTQFGIDYDEIKLINKIMEYLESHKAEINALCEGYDLQDRECFKSSSE